VVAYGWIELSGWIGDFPSFDFSSTGRMILDLADGSEHFLCMVCVEKLPEDRDPTAEDVEALSAE